MIGIVFIGVMTALAVFAILAKTCAGGPKKAEKWEKGEIIKQLLALSDGENSSSAIASPPARSRSVSTSATRSDTLRKSTSRKRNSKRRHPPTVPSPLFHSDQTGAMPKSKKGPANARMSCIKNAAAWMETQQMTGCKQSRKYCATKPERAPPRPNQFSRSSQLPAQRGCFPCRLENRGPAYRTKR